MNKTMHAGARVALLALLAQVAFTAQARAAEPPVNDKLLSDALARHLARAGQLCVGKQDWPITVTPQDIAMRQRNAVQLPAMAQAGLVDATPGEGDAMVFTLNEKGRRWYWPRQVGAGPATVHDFCAGTLKLDRLVRWSAPALAGGHYETVATYTYTFAAAEWTLDPRLQLVFPIIDRVVKGQRSAQLAQRMRFVDGRWEAVTTID